MNTKVNKAFFLIPVCYAAVIIFLLYMQFSGSHAFSVNAADISMYGRTHSGAPGQDDVISELTVSFNEIDFSFGNEDPVLVYTHDGLTHQTAPISYRVTATGIDIYLSKELSISFYYSAGNDDNINIRVSAGDPASIKYIKLPISSDTSTLSLMEDVPILSITSETAGSFYLTLPQTGTFIPEEGTIVIYPEEEDASQLVFERTAGSGIDAYTYWLSGKEEIITGEQLAAAVRDYIDKSEEALMGIRYNQTRGSWTDGDGKSSFSEQALVMAASESLGTSDYKQVKVQLDRAAASNSRNLGLLSASLFGNIVNTVWSYDQELTKKPAELKKIADELDFSVFEDPDLIAAVVTEKSDSLVESLAELSLTIPDSDISLNQAAAMLSFYSRIAENAPRTGERFTVIPNLIETAVLPSLTVLNDSLYIAEEENHADIQLTLEFGLLLLEVTADSPSADYISIGRELINSALMLSDEIGFIPENLTLSEDGSVSTEGAIAPEIIYPLLTENSYYPNEDFFYVETGDQIGIRNQAKDFTVEKTDFGYKLNFKFPAGQTHTFAVRNIQPFEQVNMLGYKWNPDHRFLNYSSGWWYDKQHNTMFVKIRHRQELEEILIYNKRPTAPAEPVNDETAASGTAAEE